MIDPEPGTPEHAERKRRMRRECERRRREAHPNKQKFGYRVRKAFRQGRLVREPCWICGEKESDAHHEDHRRLLHVWWLCRKHHMRYHGRSYEEIRLRLWAQGRLDSP